ncbi:MAG TPA: cysteine synthase family protein [Anaerolineae bacterium]|nr:cysteine synthase family protein [Anaerolineae bacterium]
MQSRFSKTVAGGVLDLIGNTPLVRLNRIGEGLGCEILGKLEYLNPSGSIKDRIALSMIENAEKRGDLKPGYRIVEASTGNTGIALSFVAAVKGYPMTVYMPKAVASEERKRMMESFGAEIELVGTEDLDSSLDPSVHGGVIEIVPRQKCKEVEAANPHIWWARQFSNPDNVAAHRETTGKEILEQTGGQIDAFVASIGTGGTLMGVAQAIKPVRPETEMIAVEPAGAPWIGRGKEAIPFIEGITDGLLFDILNQGVPNEIVWVNDENAVQMARRLAREEGLFCGMSAGANVFAALQVAQRLGRGKTVVAILTDSRDRYLTTERYIT